MRATDAESTLRVRACVRGCSSGACTVAVCHGNGSVLPAIIDVGGRDRPRRASVRDGDSWGMLGHSRLRMRGRRAFPVPVPAPAGAQLLTELLRPASVESTTTVCVCVCALAIDMI